MPSGTGDNLGIVKELPGVNGKWPFLWPVWIGRPLSMQIDEPRAVVPEKHLDLIYDRCMDCLCGYPERKGKPGRSSS